MIIFPFIPTRCIEGIIILAAAFIDAPPFPGGTYYNTRCCFRWRSSFSRFQETSSSRGSYFIRKLSLSFICRALFVLQQQKSKNDELAMNKIDGFIESSWIQFCDLQLGNKLTARQDELQWGGVGAQMVSTYIIQENTYLTRGGTTTDHWLTIVDIELQQPLPSHAFATDSCLPPNLVKVSRRTKVLSDCCCMR